MLRNISDDIYSALKDYRNKKITEVELDEIIAAAGGVDSTDHIIGFGALHNAVIDGNTDAAKVLFDEGVVANLTKDHSEALIKILNENCQYDFIHLLKLYNMDKSTLEALKLKNYNQEIFGNHTRVPAEKRRTPFVSQIHI